MSDLAHAHLLVEHGLEDTAAITFLADGRPYPDLTYEEQRRLLAISYNSLVDWHVHVHPERVAFVFNRTDPPEVVEEASISRGSLDPLRRQAFETIAGKRPTPNLPALDTALVDTISYWRRHVSGELEGSFATGALSALFNAIILVRAVEDHRRRRSTGSPGSSTTLLDAWVPSDRTGVGLGELLLSHLQDMTGQEPPSYLVDAGLLREFDALACDSVRALLSDFYHNRFARPYDYDFSLISKHALSQIYERYVSVLHAEESSQTLLPIFPDMPREELHKAHGSVYTPQFIARFFGRYLREQMPPGRFRQLLSADPACGSGIFLRTLLELQCDPVHDGVRTDSISEAFRRALGLDWDENACQAARLSLSLLHLVLTNRLPQDLRVQTGEAIHYFRNHPELRSQYDVVIANPPFVQRKSQTPTMRERVTDFMDGYAEGRIDLYLVFLRLALEMLSPGGYGLFVLPHSFLLADSASRMRSEIARTCWIRCLADISSIPVFRDVGSYVVLFIFQKRPRPPQAPPPATILKCRDMVTRALEYVVEGRSAETSSYSIYNVDQDHFAKPEWAVLPLTELRTRTRFERLPTLDDFLHVREGFVSGADEVFIRPAHSVPREERAIYVPFLRDRDMRPYRVPDRTSRYFFYPYIGDDKITEEALRADFPRTWDYLSSCRKALAARPPVRSGERRWWEPHRPRMPQNMMRPKIVTPHLVFVPRFSLDRRGRYAVSHSPFLYPKEPGAEDDLLLFFLGVLNSRACYWHVAAHSHKYRRGYAMLEPKTLKHTPVPDPEQLASGDLQRLVDLTEARLVTSDGDPLALEREIDEVVAELYGLTIEDRRALGME